MDRNNMRSSYVNSGTRSLPHMSKRHMGNGHNGNGHNGNGHNGNGHNGNGHNGNGHNGNGHNGGHNGNHSGHYSGSGHGGARLSPPAQSMSIHGNQHTQGNNQNNQHDDLISYIYESWNKVTRELERGSEDAKYYQEVVAPRHLANFRPFNLDEWWGRRFMQTINRNKHRS